MAIATIVHNNLLQSLTHVGYTLMASSTSQSLWITHLPCATNPHTNTFVVIPHVYRLIAT